MAYLVVAYPEIEKENFDLIQNYRKKNDILSYSVIDPHFTIVFPVFDLSETSFLMEIEKQTKNCNMIE